MADWLAEATVQAATETKVRAKGESMWVKTSRGGGEDKTGRSVAEVGQSPVGKPEGKTARERGVADVNTPFVRRSDVPEILRKGQDEPQKDSSGRGATAEGGRVGAPR